LESLERKEVGRHKISAVKISRVPGVWGKECRYINECGRTLVRC